MMMATESMDHEIQAFNTNSTVLTAFNVNELAEVEQSVDDIFFIDYPGTHLFYL